MKEVFIVDGVRTPIGSFGGTLAEFSSAELGKLAAKALLERTRTGPEAVDEVLFGSIYQAGCGQNVARQIAMGAGIPRERTALTLNMLCGSGLRTVALAAQEIKCGDAEVVVAGGAESMSNATYLLKKARCGYKMGHGEIFDSLIYDGLNDVFNNYHMGVTAENLAVKYGLTREQQDLFAVGSQNKAEKALAADRFREEIAPVAITDRKGNTSLFGKDEYPKAGMTLEKLSKLRPAFKKDGTVTAGNASGINDAAADHRRGEGFACRTQRRRPGRPRLCLRLPSRRGLDALPERRGKPHNARYAAQGPGFRLPAPGNELFFHQGRDGGQRPYELGQDALLWTMEGHFRVQHLQRQFPYAAADPL